MPTNDGAEIGTYEQPRVVYSLAAWELVVTESLVPDSLIPTNWARAKVDDIADAVISTVQPGEVFVFRGAHNVRWTYQTLTERGVVRHAISQYGGGRSLTIRTESENAPVPVDPRSSIGNAVQEFKEITENPFTWHIRKMGDVLDRFASDTLGGS